MDASLDMEPSVEFLILADRAEVVDGKLYMMGGGWEQVGVMDFEQPVPVGLAIAITVPWHATNRQHTFAVAFQTSDGVTLNALEGQFNVGRPALIEPGTSQRAMLAMNGAVPLPEPGTYVVVASIDGQESRRITFRANPGQPTAA